MVEAGQSLEQTFSLIKEKEKVIEEFEKEKGIKVRVKGKCDKCGKDNLFEFMVCRTEAMYTKKGEVFCIDCNQAYNDSKLCGWTGRRLGDRPQHIHEKVSN